MMYVRFPRSLRNVEDLLFERGYDISYETVRMWWDRFGPLFAADIKRQRINCALPCYNGANRRQVANRLAAPSSGLVVGDKKDSRKLRTKL